MTDDLEMRRRRAAYRACHRGTKEMDFILGRFAQTHLPGMTGAALDDFERFIAVPDPVIDVAIEPRTQADQQGLSKALQLLTKEDPSLHIRQDAESGQTLLSGMGELQLEVSLEKLRARFGINVAVGQPQVAYRETITRDAEVNHVHKKQSGGPGQFAEVRLKLGGGGAIARMADAVDRELASGERRNTGAYPPGSVARSGTETLKGS